MKYPARDRSCSSVFLGCGSTVGDACFPGRDQPVAAGLADALTASVVLVVGGDVADPGVQPHRVVLQPGAVEFAFELCGVFDLLQVWPLTLDVPEQGLDPGLVLRRVRAAELLGDRDAGQELP